MAHRLRSHACLVALVLLSCLFASCARPQDTGSTYALQECVPPQTHELVATDESEAPETPKLKNVILMIGDGMGPQHVGLLELYARYAGDERYPKGLSNLGKMLRDGATGLVITTPGDGLVIESAAGATQIGTGKMTNYGNVGIGMDGKPLESAVHIAKKHGLRTGLVTDTRITHATPAAFAAHTDDRWDETSIAVQMLETAPDLMFAGGWRYFLPRSVKKDKALMTRLTEEYELPPDGIRSVRKDERNLLDEARDAGYSIVSHPAALDDISTLPVLGLFAPNGMQNGKEWWTEQDSDSPSEPSLATMSTRAVELLSAEDQGFFLMIEGGQIDWASHLNQPQRLLYEMIRFDDAIGAISRWASERDDTLVIVTADHETGGFSLTYDKDGPPNASIFDTLDDEKTYVQWATTNHTHTPVIAVATGETEYTRAFAGLYHQTQLGEILLDLIRGIQDPPVDTEVQEKESNELPTADSTAPVDETR